jgi:hypothetical protein
MSELTSNYPETVNIVKEHEEKCNCPYSIESNEIKDSKHKLCGGIVDISKIKIIKVKGGTK